jgi:DNA repair protein RadD
MQLRYYQQEAINNALNDKKLNPIIVLPTGAGKSIVIKEISEKLNGKVLVLQPNKEILEQNYKKYKEYHCDCSIYSASCNIKEINRVTFATIGSIINATNLFNQIEVIIIDECHLVDSKYQESMYISFINKIKVNVIGLTATPYRMHSTLKFGSSTKMLHQTKNSLFKKICYNINPKELIEKKFLSQIKYYDVKFTQLEILKINQNQSDFINSSIDYFINYHINSILNLLKTISQKHKSILVFCKSIEHAKKINQYLNAYNLKSEQIDSFLSKEEREKIIKKFKNHQIQIIINVGVLTTGFDFPELDCIILARPTLSISLYYQMVGRGLRIAKDKECCHVYDLCGNVERFGKVEDLKIITKNNKDNLCGIINGVQMQLTHVNKNF